MRVAVVGAGRWGQELVRAFRAQPGLRSVVVHDIDADRAEAVGARSLGVEVAREPPWLDPTVDAVAIATPLSTHARLARLALAANKHVLVEKPMTATVEDARALVEAADAAERVLMVGHTSLYSPAVEHAARVLSRGDLGELRYLSCTRVNLGRHRPDASVLWDLASHDLANLAYWLGRGRLRVRAIGRAGVQDTLPEVGFVQLELEGGPIANIEVSWLAPARRRRSVLVGTRRTLVIEDDHHVALHDRGVTAGADGRPAYRSGPTEVTPLGSEEPLLRELSHFLDCVRNGTRPRTDGRLGLAVVRVLAAIDRSLERGETCQARQDDLLPADGPGARAAGDVA